MAKRRSYGRIKKTPGKLYEQKFTSRASGVPMTYNFPVMPSGKRTLSVKLYVGRSTSHRGGKVRANYEAVACFGKAAFRKNASGCGTFQTGRTVQSAAAKALKSLATKTALRGRKD